VSTVEAAVMAMAALAAAGALPVLVLVGPRWPAVPLAPLAGSVIAGLAGVACLAVTGTPLVWFTVLAGLAAAGSVLCWRRWGLPGDSSDADPARFSGLARWVGVIAAVAVGAALVWSLLPLRVPSVGWDAQSIWLMRASWFVNGHGFLLAQSRNPALLLTHASYPPLVSSSVAVAWQLTGDHGDRLGVVIVSLLDAAGMAAAAWVAVAAGLAAAGRAVNRSRAALGAGVGVLGAGLFVLAATGVFGPFTTNGYADPLWTITAAGAIGYGLLLAPDRSTYGSAAILLGVCGLSKVEGTAIGIGIMALVVARVVLGRWWDRPGRRTVRQLYVDARGPILLGALGAAALGLWPVLTRVDHFSPDVNTSGPRQGSLLERAHLTVDAMVPHLHVLLVAIPLAVAAAVVLGRTRRAIGLGNDLWAWSGAAIGLLAIFGAYVTGPGNVSVWLLTSVHRTTMFPAVTAWLVMAVWGVVATSTAPDTAVPFEA